MFFVILITMIIIVIAVVVLSAMRKKAKLEKEEREKEKQEQELLTKAEQGDIEAQVKLGGKFLNGGDTIEKNPYKAIEWFNKAIEQGSAEAHYCLANCYKSGEGIQKDLSKAKSHLQQAAEKGHTGAQAALMDAVDYYNRGIRNLRDSKFSEAEWDFSDVIYRDELEGKTKEIEMRAYLNRGIAHYNQALGKEMNEAVTKTTYAISDWEEVLRSDSDQERRAQAKELIEKVKRERGF